VSAVKEYKSQSGMQNRKENFP